MLTVIITTLAALRAKQFKTVLWVAIVAPIILGIATIIGRIGSTDYYIIATLINIPVDIVVGFFVFKYAERKRKRKAISKAMGN